MAILTSGEYPEIRAALVSDLDANQLPDSIIAMSIYAGAADQDVISIISDAESKTGDDATRVLNAAIYFCAARLASVVIRITSMSVQARGLTFSKPVFDPDKMADHLRELALEELTLVSSTVVSMPTFIDRAPGYRGR